MVLVKSVKFGHILIFRKHFTFLAMFLFFAKYTKKMCLTIFCKKNNCFQDYKNKKLKKSKIGIFPRGQSMVLVKSVKFGHVFIFRQISQKKEFNIILEQKNAFKTIKKRSLKNRRIGIFSKGLVHGFDQKCEIWPFSSPK